MILGNMVKQRANFAGFHTYSYGELTNWIGPASSVLANGSVSDAVPGADFATAGGGASWVANKTITPFPTSEYWFGAASLFDTDCFSGNAYVLWHTIV